MLSGGKVRTVHRRSGPEVGKSPRDILLTALAVVTVVAVIASGAADAFLHGSNPSPAARVAAGGVTGGPPVAAEAAAGTSVTDSGILPARSPAAAVAPGGVQTAEPRRQAVAGPAEAMPMAMPLAPA